MGQLWKQNTLILIILIFAFDFAEAQQRTKKSEFQATKVGFILMNYSGSTNKSFSQGANGYALELSSDSGGSYFRYFLKGRISHSEGKQNFVDNVNTMFNSTYKFSGFSPEIGISVYPVRRRESGLNMYLWGVGIVSYNYLDLATIPASSSVKQRDQGYGTGYGGGLGFEFVIAPSRSGSRYLVYGEVGFRDERVNLLQRTDFEIAGMSYSLGFGF